MSIPKYIERLLWEYDLDGLDDSGELPNTIYERVMSCGGWTEMLWLIRTVSPDRLRSYLEKRGARILPPREIAFWSLVCSVPNDLADTWIGAARARQEEWRG